MTREELDKIKRHLDKLNLDLILSGSNVYIEQRGTFKKPYMLAVYVDSEGLDNIYASSESLYNREYQKFCSAIKHWTIAKTKGATKYTILTARRLLDVNGSNVQHITFDANRLNTYICRHKMAMLRACCKACHYHYEGSDPRRLTDAVYSFYLSLLRISVYAPKQSAAVKAMTLRLDKAIAAKDKRD